MFLWQFYLVNFCGCSKCKANFLYESGGHKSEYESAELCGQLDSQLSNYSLN